MRRRRRVNKRDQASAFCASRSPATRRALTPTGPYKGSISLIPIESLIALKRARPCLYGTRVQSRAVSRVDCISVSLVRIHRRKADASSKCLSEIKLPTTVVFDYKNKNKFALRTSMQFITSINEKSFYFPFVQVIYVDIQKCVINKLLIEPVCKMQRQRRTFS